MVDSAIFKSKGRESPVNYHLSEWITELERELPYLDAAPKNIDSRSSTSDQTLEENWFVDHYILYLLTLS